MISDLQENLKFSDEELTPSKIKELLDRFIIGQDNAKKYVALALRNRWRRLQVSKEMINEITPKNIIMIGSTGVGKTEIARRVAKIVKAPFVKIEASKFTEVGYVGRNVESIIRDLVEVSVSIVKTELREKYLAKARHYAYGIVLDKLLPPVSNKNADGSEKNNEQSRESIRQKLVKGELNERKIKITVNEGGGKSFEMIPVVSTGDSMDFNLKDMMGNFLPKKPTEREMSVAEALKYFEQEEVEKLIEKEDVSYEAIQRVENNGIVFLDEIDKIAGRTENTGTDISREGVQRDLLPIVEGSTVNTRYGQVNTDHILFIAAGAFHVSKPSDLIPELQGRFPIRVELDSLKKEDFIRILTEPKNAIVKQYVELLKTEGLELSFEESAINAIAENAYEVNTNLENIGARRLHTILEKILEEVSFDAPNLKEKKIIINEEYVNDKLGDIVKSRDLSRYIL